MKKYLLIFAVFLLLVVVSSCNRTETPTVVPTSEIAPGYPANQIVNSDTAYPSGKAITTPSTSANLNTKVYGPDEFPATPEPPTPQDGKGSVSGVLFSANGRYTIPQTVFYLTLGWGDNKDEVPSVFIGPGKDDIIFHTDENGQFSLDNIPPGKYYLVMSALPYDWALGYKDTKLTPYRLDVEAGSKIAAGIVYVFWP